nr:hairy-related 3 isoform X2 [Doryrhamphus excisus]
MVARTDCMDKSNSITPNKVPKPLMEKKRRARINKCLEQLKCLLESHYSSSICKRKLEKADILELTVRYFKHLQKTQTYLSTRGELSDYQRGFHSCLANFNHYLLMAGKNVTDRDRLKLAQLRGKLCFSSAPQEISSTTDSGPGLQAMTQDLARRAEAAKSVPAVSVQGASHFLPSEHARRLLPRTNRGGLVAATSSKDNCEKPPTHKKSTSPREVGSTHDKMWRPW